MRKDSCQGLLVTFACSSCICVLPEHLFLSLSRCIVSWGQALWHRVMWSKETQVPRLGVSDQVSLLQCR